MKATTDIWIATSEGGVRVVRRFSPGDDVPADVHGYDRLVATGAVALQDEEE